MEHTPRRFYSSRRTSDYISPNSIRNRSTPRMCYGPGDTIEASCPTEPAFTMSGCMDDSVIHEPELMPNGQMDALFKMLQTQGKQMEEILRTQQEMKADQSEMWQQLKANKNKEKKPRKKQVTRILTDRINMIHETLSKKINPNESSTSAHNKGVMSTLIEEVKGDTENEFSKETITLAVKRKYQAERRSLKEESKGESFKKDRTKKAKYDQRKKRAHERRGSVITRKEQQYWQHVTKEYMSDESDTSDTELITVHKHSWRSEKFNQWMEELDKRYKKKLETNSSVTPSKQRIVGSPSSSQPPRDAPTWAVDQEWNCLGNLSEGEGSDGLDENEGFDFCA